MTEMKIAVVGSCNTDMTFVVDRFPLPGETILGTNFFTGFGGKGANQAICAARLGANVGMVARVGADSFGNEQILNFRTNNVNADFVTRSSDKISTGVAQICVNKSTGENTITVIPGANAELSPEDIYNSCSIFNSAKILMCQMEIAQETVLAALKLAKSRGVMTIFNPTPVASLIDGILECTDILCLNEVELDFYSNGLEKKSNYIEAAARHLQCRGNFDLIVTMGKNGVLWLPAAKHEKSVHVPVTENVEVVDTTGAGDAFIGALAAYLSKQHPMADALKAAVRIASLSVSSVGAQSSYPYVNDQHD